MAYFKRAPALTSPLLELRQLSCERDERLLFSELNVKCHAGDLLQIVGPNGCGKTTLLRALAGISTNYQGDILWRGRPVQHTRWGYASELLFLGHLPGIKKALTPRENLHWYSALTAPSENVQILEALTQVQLDAYTDTPCYQLSAGQLRRVALARLYLSRASLWILDEPFTAIDKPGVTQLELCFQEHAAQGGIVIFTSHQDLTLPGLKHIHLLDYQRAAGSNSGGAVGYDD